MMGFGYRLYPSYALRSDPFIAYENIKNKMSNAVSYILLAIDKETK